MADPLGVDIKADPDLDPYFRLVRGRENLQCAIARRLHTNAGALEDIGDDPNYGYNVVGQLNRETSNPRELAEVQSRSQAEVLKDPRIELAQVQAINAPNLPGAG
jgi:hypothetical protein